MKFDRYTKIMLTVIALCLMWLCARGTPPVASAAATAVAVPKVVRAQRFELVDFKGRVRASLITDQLGCTGLYLYDKSGKQTVALADDAVFGFAELQLGNSGRKELSGTPKGAFSVRASNKENESDEPFSGNISILVGGTGPSELALLGTPLALYNKDYKVCGELRMNPDKFIDGPELRLSNKGKSAYLRPGSIHLLDLGKEMSVEKTSSAYLSNESLTLKNERGKVELKQSKGGFDVLGSGLLISDEKGHSRVWAMLLNSIGTAQGGPKLALFDENSKIMWRAPQEPRE